MNLNLVQVAGRLTAKPELKEFGTGNYLTTFSVATNMSWKDKQGNKKEEVEFHNVTAFGKTAEFVAKYFDKGQQIYIQGRLKTDSWEDKATQQKRYKTAIMAEKAEFVDSKAKGGAEYSQPTVSPVSINSDIGTVNIDDLPF